MLRYTNNFFSVLLAYQGPNFVRFSTVGFRSFANIYSELPSCGHPGSNYDDFSHSIPIFGILLSTGT